MAKQKKPKEPTEELKSVSPDQTPEISDAAATEEIASPKNSKKTADTSPSATPTDPSLKVVKTTPPTPSRKRLWWMVGGGAAVLAGAAAAGWFFWRTPAATNTNTTLVNNSQTTTALEPRLLDGVMVDPTKTNPNIYAVMIENIKESRPPSGLDKASIVYEALAEGGITRFLALFPLTTSVAEIGPVRSARPYYIAWAEEYNKSLYVHVGGSPQALEYIRNTPSAVLDFNQFYYATNFWRDKTRFAPHNLYTSSDKLFLGLKTKAPNNVPSYTSWSYKDEAEVSARPETTNDIVIDFSSFNYRVTYKYDRTNNYYLRYLGDTQHVTRDNQPIFANNVVVMFVKTGLIPGERQRLELETTGQGRVLIFRDGVRIEGIWKKDGNRDRLQFQDSNGQPIQLNRGKTWISAVPTDRNVTF